ncbi:MAG: hypothetical protein ACREBZ_06205 [Thermoplasmata archaeon]
MKRKNSSAKSKPRASSRPKPRPKSAGSAKASAKRRSPPRKPPAHAPVPKTPPKKSGNSAPPLPPPPPRVIDGRRHVLSLSFLRDGDEFFARIEGNAGQITEFKNRALDQLLTLVASELEDLVE